MTEKTQRDLIGKGGIGLVQFYLAKTGLEFAQTSHFSAQGDLWVSQPSGRVVKTEVKTASGYSWRIKQHQVVAVDFLLFVSLRSAEIWILTRAEVEAIARTLPQHQELIRIDRKDLPRSGHSAWNKLKGVTAANGSHPSVLELAGPFEGRARTVKRKMADGSIKAYTYLEAPGRKRRRVPA